MRTGGVHGTHTTFTFGTAYQLGKLKPYSYTPNVPLLWCFSNNNLSGDDLDVRSCETRLVCAETPATRHSAYVTPPQANVKNICSHVALSQHAHLLTTSRTHLPDSVRCSSPHAPSASAVPGIKMEAASALSETAHAACERPCARMKRAHSSTEACATLPSPLASTAPHSLTKRHAPAARARSARCRSSAPCVPA
eukprot:scaffold108735_cov69-Phaeocystis_antarctica.AAC.1